MSASDPAAELRQETLHLHEQDTERLLLLENVTNMIDSHPAHAAVPVEPLPLLPSAPPGRDHADDRAPMTTTPMTSPMTSPTTSPMMTSPMPSPMTTAQAKPSPLDGEIRRNDDEYNEDFFAALDLVDLDNSWMRGARARAHHEA